MATFQDLKSKLDSDLSTQASDAKALSLATAAKSQSDADVSADTIAFSTAVKAAPGGFVVDATTSTVVLYQSSDGATYTSTVIASITDSAPGTAPAPNANPNPPAS